MPKPRGSFVSVFIFKICKANVRDEPIKRMGPREDAPKTDPIPPSNKKSPDPIPSMDLIILCT